MENELPDVLDGTFEPVSVEELEDVVRRAGQRRRATLAAGAAGLLVLGALGGALARGPAGDGSGGFAGESEEPTPTRPAPADAMTYGGGMMAAPNQKLDPLFRREANGVAIRAYRASWNLGEPKGNPACAPPDMAQGQLSNGAAVTMAMAPLFKTSPPPDPNLPVALLTTGVFGEAEGEPATWFIVEARSARVRVNASQSTDTMEPKDGIAILVLSGTNNPATIEALDADGKVLGSQALDKMTAPRVVEDPACAPPPCSSPGNPSGTAPVETKPAQDPAAVAPAPPPPHGDCVVACAAESPPPPPTTLPPGEGPPVTKPFDLGSSTGHIDGPCPVPMPMPGSPPVTGKVLPPPPNAAPAGTSPPASVASGAPTTTTAPLPATTVPASTPPTSAAP